jgi:hypothetical protein
MTCIQVCAQATRLELCAKAIKKYISANREYDNCMAKTYKKPGDMYKYCEAASVVDLQSEAAVVKACYVQ